MIDACRAAFGRELPRFELGLFRLGRWLPKPADRRKELEALKGRVETLEGSILEILRTVETALETARRERLNGPAAPEEPAADSAPAEQSADAAASDPAQSDGTPELIERIRPEITAPEMWAATPEIWIDTPAEAHPVAAAETPAALPEDAPVAKPKRGRRRASPAADREPSIPPASTSDGRELTRIRQTVLRLNREGWPVEKISGKVRLGVGDVNLILRTDLLRPKPDRAELAHSGR